MSSGMLTPRKPMVIGQAAPPTKATQIQRDTLQLLCQKWWKGYEWLIKKAAPYALAGKDFPEELYIKKDKFEHDTELRLIEMIRGLVSVMSVLETDTVFFEAGRAVCSPTFWTAQGMAVFYEKRKAFNIPTTEVTT